MAVFADALFERGVEFARFIPRNDDGTIPLGTDVYGGAGYLMGGAGPFDFSGVDDDSAIPIHAKIDDAAVIDETIDLSVGVADISAVTVDELVTALTGKITGFTFSKDAATGRLKSVPESGTYWQLYGEFAEVAKFGQGFGVKIIKSDTFESIPDSPIVKDDQDFVQTTAKGVDITVTRDGYTKGSTLTGTDTAKDPELRKLALGESVDPTSGFTLAPTSVSKKYAFYMETFSDLYDRSATKESNIVAYMQRIYLNCKASVGDEGHDADWSKAVYTIKATQGRDASGSPLSHMGSKKLTVEEYEALDVANV